MVPFWTRFWVPSGAPRYTNPGPRSRMITSTAGVDCQPDAPGLMFCGGCGYPVVVLRRNRNPGASSLAQGELRQILIEPVSVTVLGGIREQLEVVRRIACLVAERSVPASSLLERPRQHRQLLVQVVEDPDLVFVRVQAVQAPSVLRERAVF